MSSVQLPRSYALTTDRQRNLAIFVIKTTVYEEHFNVPCYRFGELTTSIYINVLFTFSSALPSQFPTEVLCIEVLC